MPLSYVCDHDEDQELLVVRPDQVLEPRDLVALFSTSREDDAPRMFDLRVPFACRIERSAVDDVIGDACLKHAPVATTAIVAASPSQFNFAQDIALAVNRRGPRRVQRVRAFYNVTAAKAWLGKEPWDDLARLRANLSVLRRPDGARHS